MISLIEAVASIQNVPFVDRQLIRVTNSNFRNSVSNNHRGVKLNR